MASILADIDRDRPQETSIADVKNVVAGPYLVSDQLGRKTEGEPDRQLPAAQPLPGRPVAVNDVPTYQCLVLATDGAFETSGGLRAMLPTTLPGGTLGFAGVPPTRADPGQAVTLIPRRVLFSGVPRRRSTATCGHDVGQAGRVRMAPCASRSGAANLHRRGEHPQAARRRRRGQGFHIHRLRHTAAVRWLRSEAPKPAYARTPGGRPTDASLARSTPPSTTSFRASRP